MPTPILLTKLYTPPVRPGLVPRPRLVERLDAGLHRRLTLVCAPAGYGKSTLVAEWLHRVDRPYAWVSLDEGDSDPVAFLTYLVAALGAIHQDVGRATLGMLSAPQPPPGEVMMGSLINDIATLCEPFVLALDDYHLIRSLAVHELLAFLLNHQPRQMHLLIMGREDPPMPLARLRAGGMVTDIRQADLAFTADETAAFFGGATTVALDPAATNALHERMEGWIAGLQLAALSLRSPDDVAQLLGSLGGGGSYVLDYLMEEVFSRQGDAVRRFLLSTAILDRLSAGLCDALTGRDDGRAMLERLLEANLFIMPLDAAGGWYRYHHLFGDLLRHRAEINPEIDTADLHRRASDWFAAHDQGVDAVRHAIAAEDWARASNLLVGWVSDDLLKGGRTATLLGLIEAIPRQVILDNPHLSLECAWPLLLIERLDEAEEYLESAEAYVVAAEEQRAAAKACPAAAERAASVLDDPALRGNILVARVHIARVRGDHAAAMVLSEQALAALPEDEYSGRCIVGLNLGMARWYRGEIDAAAETLNETERAARQVGNDYVRFTALFFRNRLRAARGRLREAVAVCRRMVERAADTPIAGIAHYDLARFLYEWDALDEAAEHLEVGLRGLRPIQAAEFIVGGCSTLAHVVQTQGDTARAQQLLGEAREWIARVEIPPATQLAHLVGCLRTALARHDHDAAQAIVDDMDPLESYRSFPDAMAFEVARGRLLLARGRYAEAAQRLAGVRAMADAAGACYISAQLVALQALAAPHPDAAMVFLAEALVAAESMGLVRTYLDAGEPMAALLRDAQACGIAPEATRRLLAAFEAQGAPAPEPPGPTSIVLPYGETLSERELEMLRGLADGLTNREIAQSLYLSVNTVKTHLRNLYGKLGVSTRRDAVATARKLGLLQF